MKGDSEEVSCQRCGNLGPGMPHICTWNNAEVSPRLVDAECPGFVPLIKSLGTSKTGTGSPHTQNPENSLILAALELKELKGSIVLERVKCGKRSCHCQRGSLHPANYLHYYKDSKVRRKYLSKTMVALLKRPKEELKNMLHASARSQSG